jgi:hypothetical protein
MVSTGSIWNKFRPARTRGTKMRHRAVTASGLLSLVVLGAGCGPDPSTARGAAERFLDAHFVRIDLPAAHALTAGVARHKVEEEIRLTEGQPIDAATRKPMVHYRLLEEHGAGDDGVSFLYQGSVEVEDAEGIEPRWMVTVRRDGERWQVTNWQELGG